jgi:signal transduction histidine kinase
MRAEPSLPAPGWARLAHARGTLADACLGHAQIVQIWKNRRSGELAAHSSRSGSAATIILNLIVNAIEAMSGVGAGARELLISTRKAEPNGVLVSVRDSGRGIGAGVLERVFDAFYSTKSGALGMGLSICRSIIEAHGGRLWASANVPNGAALEFTVSAQPDITS